MKFVPKPLEDAAENSSGQEHWREKAKNVVIIIVGVTLIYLLLGFIAEFMVTRISEETEAKLFQSIEFPTEENPPAEFARAEEVFDKLLEQPGLRPLPYKLRYMSTPEPNAFAAPGGTVMVTKGLLDATTNTTAIAFVLGHELGHHQHRHTLKGIGRKAVFSIAIGLVFGASDGGIVSKAVDLAEKGHSRNAEREADDFGFRLAHSVYGSADGYMEFFEHLHDKYHGKHETWLNFAHTHPPTTERLEHLRELQSELEGK